MLDGNGASEESYRKNSLRLSRRAGDLPRFFRASRSWNPLQLISLGTLLSSLLVRCEVPCTGHHQKGHLCPARHWPRAFMRVSRSARDRNRCNFPAYFPVSANFGQRRVRSGLRPPPASQGPRASWAFSCPGPAGRGLSRSTSLSETGTVVFFPVVGPTFSKHGFAGANVRRATTRRGAVTPGKDACGITSGDPRQRSKPNLARWTVQSIGSGTCRLSRSAFSVGG